MSIPEGRGRAPQQSDLPPIPILNIPDNAASLSTIRELGIWTPDPNAQLAALLALPRDKLHEASLVLTYLLTQADLLERLLDVAIAVLDTKDGNTDLEENNDLEDDSSSDLEDDQADREEDDPAEHDDDDTDDAYEDVPTKGWFTTPSGTAYVSDFQKAIGDGKPGDPVDAEVDVASPIFPGNLPRGSAEQFAALDASRAAGWEHDDFEDCGSDGS
jgi:hypothetical protein